MGARAREEEEGWMLSRHDACAQGIHSEAWHHLFPPAEPLAAPTANSRAHLLCSIKLPYIKGIIIVNVNLVCWLQVRALCLHKPWEMWHGFENSLLNI